jgi:hypothetical protein
MSRTIINQAHTPWNYKAVVGEALWGDKKYKTVLRGCQNIMGSLFTQLVKVQSRLIENLVLKCHN